MHYAVLAQLHYHFLDYSSSNLVDLFVVLRLVVDGLVCFSIGVLASFSIGVCSNVRHLLLDVVPLLVGLVLVESQLVDSLLEELVPVELLVLANLQVLQVLQVSQVPQVLQVVVMVILAEVVRYPVSVGFQVILVLLLGILLASVVHLVLLDHPMLSHCLDCLDDLDLLDQAGRNTDNLSVVEVQVELEATNRLVYNQNQTMPIELLQSTMNCCFPGCLDDSDLLDLGDQMGKVVQVFVHLVTVVIRVAIACQVAQDLQVAVVHLPFQGILVEI